MELPSAAPKQKPTTTPTASPDELAALVASSPVARRARQAPQDPARVALLGGALETAVRALDSTVCDEAVETRVYRYYLPIYFWMAGMLAEHQANSTRPLVVGFSCPQGGGKTTMVSFMRVLFQLDGKVCAGASLDDFYLTYEEQTNVASEYWSNGLLRYRGNPGTHDVDLLGQTLDRIALFNTPEAPPCVAVPTYDKTRYSGRGDRAPGSRSELVSDGLDVFLLEGWCMGFQAVGQEHAFEDPSQSPSGDLRVVDKFLEEFHAIYERIDGMLVIEVDDLNCVFEWRAQPEREAIAAGKCGLSPEEVRDFVSRFIPTYELYTPRLYDRKDSILGEGKELHIKINQKRQPCEGML